jgi:hypothetical protein
MNGPKETFNPDEAKVGFAAFGKRIAELWRPIYAL